MKLRFVIYIRIALVYASSGGGGLQAQESIGHYIVKLRDEPVVTHLSHQPAAGNLRGRLESNEAAAYRSQLRTRQSALKQWIEALPEAKVLVGVDTVFNGLAVSLRPEDVPVLKQAPGVEDVIPSIHYHKVLDAAIPLVDVPAAWTNPKVGGEGNAGRGIRIAIIDTGIDINHPMLQDTSLVPPAGFPRFTTATLQCNNSDQRFTNSKVIVARNYVSLLDNPDQNCDAEDRDGHGTFNAAIAAGLRVSAPSASISGVAPKAFLGTYKVFGTPGINDDASSAAILKAIEDAVNDHMDVINLSLGATTTALPSSDPLVMAAANAVDAGVTVVAAAGNEGPGTGTVTSPGISPAVITVGATTNSRLFGNPLLISADVSVPPQLQQIGALQGNGPKITSSVGPARLADVVTVDPSGTACSPLPQGALGGKIAFIRRGVCNFSAKIQNASDSGAIAVIFYNNQANQPPILFDVLTSTQIPSAMIGNGDGLALAQFLASAGPSVQATLQAQAQNIPTIPNQMTSFSSNGPSTDFGIKPDLVAPGENIYSAAQRNFPAGAQYDPTGFTMFSGTSFAAPIVAGAAALVKQTAPTFTPGQIKSALMNTAVKVVTFSQGGAADVLSQGNGLLDAAAALNTPVTVAPASISFGAHLPGSVSISTTNLSVTNVGTALDTFTVTVTPAPGSANLTLSPSPASFTLGAGSTSVVAVTASSFQPLNGTIEGFIAIRSQNSQSSVTVPYWGAFLNPNVNSGGAVNAASFSSGASGAAAGGLISIFGTDLANRTETAAIVPLPQSLGGVTLTIGGHTAPLLFASPTQINAQVPFEVSGSSFADLVVKLDGLSSTPVTTPILPAAPGIFTVSHGGTGRGAILHASNSTAVTSDNPARPGEFLELFVTDLGAASPPIATGTAASTTPLSFTQIIPSVSIAGVSAPVSFSGLAPSFVGLYQINIQVPAGLPAGEQTLTLTANSVTSNPVTVSIGK